MTYEAVYQPGHLDFDYSLAQVLVANDVPYRATRDVFHEVCADIEKRSACGMTLGERTATPSSQHWSEDRAIPFLPHLDEDGSQPMGALFFREA